MTMTRARATPRTKAPVRFAKLAKMPKSVQLARKLEGPCVADVMTRDPVCIETGATLRQTAELLDEHEISGLPVVDDQLRLVGVVSRTDLLRRLLEGPPEARRDEQWLDLLTADSTATLEVDAAKLGLVDDVMSSDPVTALASERLPKVARRMADEKVHRIVVVDPKSSRPVGIVTTLDLLRVFPR
jgi:CBS domain-containing protein